MTVKSHFANVKFSDVDRCYLYNLSICACISVTLCTYLCTRRSYIIMLVSAARELKFGQLNKVLTADSISHAFGDSETHSCSSRCQGLFSATHNIQAASDKATRLCPREGTVRNGVRSPMCWLPCHLCWPDWQTP